MAWALRASTPASGTVATGSAATATVTLGAAVVLGDRIIAIVNVHDSKANSTTSVTDSLGNTYTLDRPETNSGAVDFWSVWSAPVTVAGTPVITAHFTAMTTGNAIVSGAAFSGLSTASGATAIDMSVTGTGTAAAATSGATSATTAANELVIGAYADNGISGGLTVGAGYTLATTHNTDANVQTLLEYKDSGATAAQTATVTTFTGGAWVVFCVVYKLFTASTATRSTLLLMGVG